MTLRNYLRRLFKCTRMASQQQNIQNPFLLVEKEILKETNARGDLSKLAKWGDLENIVTYLYALKKSPGKERCLILTGFPCIEGEYEHNSLSCNLQFTAKRNLQETDGIAGAIAIARALGPDKCIIGIEENIESSSREVKHCAVQIVKHVLKNLGENAIDVLEEEQGSGVDTFRILCLPTQAQLRNQNTALEFQKKVVEKLSPYSIIAIEKAGYSSLKFDKDKQGIAHGGGRAYTMKGRDITSECVPVDIMKHLWDHATLRMAVGDGGNELGLGSVNILTRQYVPLGEKIACDPEFSADHVLIAGVSNWGGYSIGLGLLSKEVDQGVLSNHALIDEKSERSIAETLKEYNVCDGVSGESKNCTVDGIDFDIHMKLLDKISRMLKL